MLPRVSEDDDIADNVGPCVGGDDIVGWEVMLYFCTTPADRSETDHWFC